MSKYFIFLLIAVSTLSSCKRNVFTSSRNNKIEIIDPDFDFMTAKAKIKFDHEDKRMSATANIRMKKDSIIWMSVTPGLGIEVARVLINKQEITVVDKVNKRVHNYSFEKLSSQFGFKLDFDILQSVVLGNLIEPYTNQRVKKENNFFKYVINKGTYSFENFIGFNTMKLEKVTVEDPDSKNSISVNYGNFLEVSDQIFPQEVYAVINYGLEDKPDTEVNINFNRLNITSNPIGFPFSIPSRYERQ